MASEAIKRKAFDNLRSCIYKLQSVGQNDRIEALLKRMESETEKNGGQINSEKVRIVEMLVEEVLKVQARSFEAAISHDVAKAIKEASRQLRQTD